MDDSQSYRLLTDPTHRAGTVDRIANALLDLSIDEVYTVTVEAEQETRRQKQNRLAWVWNRQFGKHLGNRPETMHGMMKLDHLLPLKLACAHDKTRKRAEFERDVLACIPNRAHKIGAAYDLVHSHDVPLRIFAEWMTAYQQVAAEQGCRLESKTAEYDEMEVAA